MTEEEHLIVFGSSLEVHHIDYDKYNNKEYNLITLCKQCNVRANYNRNYWKEIYFLKNKDKNVITKT
jgi:5-methylcytosine-specific restriction endonuclease McrA